MERILITDLNDHVGKEVHISGWIDVARNQGKMAFFDIRDRSGSVQGVVFGKPEVLEVAKTISEEWVVAITGTVNKRPDNMVKERVQNGDIEIEITDIEVLSKSDPLPFDRDADFNLDTLLDNRPLTLRNEKQQAIFRVQAEILKAYRNFLISKDFVEFQAPKLVGGDAEGGAEVFKVEYFNDKDAFLATSPQLYKQIMVGVYERAFSTGATFRAERHATSRHLSEITMLDLEFGYIKDHADVIALVTELMQAIVNDVEEVCEKELKLFDVEKVKAPESFPVFTLLEAQELIKEHTGVDKTKAPDLDPEDERFLCEYAHNTLDSDFVFVTHFPTSKRPFYAYVDEENPEVTKSLDLLFRGLEMCSGGQRVHDYDELKERIKGKGLDPEKFSYYLQAFKYGMPPHGGIGMGLERLTAKMLDLRNVKEATLFPRDINRIDTLLTQHETTEDND